MQSPSTSSRRILVGTTVALAAAGAAALFIWRHDGSAPAQREGAGDRMSAELLRAAERGDICTAANAVGTGLKGEYFSATDLRGTAGVIRVDEVVDFDESVKWPTGAAAPAAASVRWSGWIKAPLSGKYRFHADAPHMRVLVARKIVAGEGATQGELVDLAAGRFYPVEVVVNQLPPSGQRIRLEWTAPHGARYVVPKALLNPPSETVAAPRV